MMLLWGVCPIWARRADTTDELFETSIEETKQYGYIEAGDLCIITAGVVDAMRRRAVGITNLMRVIQA